MGQKINPIGLRLGINRTWDSRWFAGKTEYGTLLHEDIKIRAMLMKELKQAAVVLVDLCPRHSRHPLLGKYTIEALAHAIPRWKSEGFALPCL